MVIKHEWRKAEKNIYLPKATPEKITIPEFRFFTIQGEGNPNDASFSRYIEVLYSLAYAVRMSPKKGFAPEGYFEYTVYPLEGVWDLNEHAKENYTGELDKNALVFTLMIRQPKFVDESYAEMIVDQVRKTKPNDLLDKIKFERITEGDCVQMLHVGPYDEEPKSFKLMEAFASKKHLKRTSKTHREIYISDPRKVEPEKLKTVLRFMV